MFNDSQQRSYDTGMADKTNKVMLVNLEQIFEKRSHTFIFIPFHFTVVCLPQFIILCKACFDLELWEGVGDGSFGATAITSVNAVRCM